jgi:hypothetical protein
MNPEIFDVAVIGGGLVGLAVAREIAVLECANLTSFVIFFNNVNRPMAAGLLFWRKKTQSRVWSK